MPTLADHPSRSPLHGTRKQRKRSPPLPAASILGRAPPQAHAQTFRLPRLPGTRCCHYSAQAANESCQEAVGCWLLLAVWLVHHKLSCCGSLALRVRTPSIPACHCFSLSSCFPSAPDARAPMTRGAAGRGTSGMDPAGRGTSCSKGRGTMERRTKGRCTRCSRSRDPPQTRPCRILEATCA